MGWIAVLQLVTGIKYSYEKYLTLKTVLKWQQNQCKCPLDLLHDVHETVWSKNHHLQYNIITSLFCGWFLQQVIPHNFVHYLFL